jgi:hypothetical protein
MPSMQRETLLRYAAPYIRSARRSPWIQRWPERVGVQAKMIELIERTSEHVAALLHCCLPRL